MGLRRKDLKLTESNLIHSSFLPFSLLSTLHNYSMLEAGTVRKKNVGEIIVKNISDVNITGLSWWAFGFSVAFVPSGNAFAGGDGMQGLFLHNVNSYGGHSAWFFQWCFVSTATSIVSGAVAERCRMSCYMGYAIVMTVAVYPVFAYWAWSTSGWLSPFNADSSTRIGNGLIDFAGCGVVHLTGGLTSLIGAYFVGPRKGRFVTSEDGVVRVIEYTLNSESLRSVGVFTLWFGWYFFNGGTVFSLDKSLDGLPAIAARVAVNTTLSACSCSLSSIVAVMMVRARKGDPIWYQGQNRDVSSVTNGVLAGLVSITASCSVVESWAAVIIGAFGSLVWLGSSKLLQQLQIDDAVDAVPVHLACGIWGLLAAAIFAEEKLVEEIYGYTDSKGLIYGGDGMYLITALLFIVCSICWNSAMMLPFFTFCDKMGLMKYSDKEIEDMLGVKSHGNIYDMVAMRGVEEHGGGADGEKKRSDLLDIKNNQDPHGRDQAVIHNGSDSLNSSLRAGDGSAYTAPFAEESRSLNDSTSTRGEGMGGVEMLVAGAINNTNGPLRAPRMDPLSSYSHSQERAHPEGLSRRNVPSPTRAIRLDIRLLEAYCARPGAILDKATVVALAIQSNAPDDVMNVLDQFDQIAGGSGVISGSSLGELCTMVRKASEAELILQGH